MLIACKRCGNVLSKDEVNKDGNGDVKQHCSQCGHTRFEIISL